MQLSVVSVDLRGQRHDKVQHKACHLCTMPLLCRKSRPSAMSMATARPRWRHPHSQVPSMSSVHKAVRRSPPCACMRAMFLGGP